MEREKSIEKYPKGLEFYPALVFYFLFIWIELFAEAMMLIKNKNTIDDVVNSLPMFPTLSESIKIVALSFTKDISKLSCCI